MTRAAVLYLFDLDGTLLRCGGAGARALDAVFAARFGLAAAMDGVDAGGRTDPYLVEQVFVRRLGRRPDPDELDSVLAAYLPELARELAPRADGGSTVRAVPGAGELLDALGARAEVTLGVATGNVAAAAALKLAAVGLAGRFAFGGFGCDSADRAALVARGIARGRAHLGRACPDERIVVVGDTVHDVAAARACGVRVVAVTTGSGTRAELEAAGADVVLDELRALPAWHDRVLG